MIDTMRKRLCGCASKETRAYAEDLKDALWKVQPELSDVLVPNCVYRCGCPEMRSCGMWKKFTDYCDISDPQMLKMFLNIKFRYNLYADWYLNEYRSDEDVRSDR